MSFVKIRMKKTLNISKTKIQVKIKNGILCFELLDNQYFKSEICSSRTSVKQTRFYHMKF